LKLLVFILILSAACDLASAEDAPQPRAKPVPEAGPSDCAVRLAEIAQFAHEAIINGPGQCGGADLVRLEQVFMPNGPSTAVIPPATLRCPMAEAVARWVRDDLGAAMAELGSPPITITNGDSYNCRGRNNRQCLHST
jgi:hypothetical protein